MSNDRVPPRVDSPSPPPPPLSADRRVTEAREELGRALKEGLNRIADSLDNALAGSRVTGRVLRELGAWEREHGMSSYPDGTGPETRPVETFTGWCTPSAAELTTAARDYRFRSDTPGIWVNLLMYGSFEVTAQSPELENSDLDDALIRLAATTVSWLKDRERRRAERDRERLSDLAEHGYDRTEGPQ